MTLAKRGRWRFTLGGVSYRWQKTYAPETLALRVELAEAPGQLLIAHFKYMFLDKDDERLVFSPTFTNPVLQDIIEAGLKFGWRPQDKGGALELSVSDTEKVVDEYSYRSTKWRRS